MPSSMCALCRRCAWGKGNTSEVTKVNYKKNAKPLSTPASRGRMGAGASANALDEGLRCCKSLVRCPALLFLPRLSEIFVLTCGVVACVRVCERRQLRGTIGYDHAKRPSCCLPSALERDRKRERQRERERRRELNICVYLSLLSLSLFCSVHKYAVSTYCSKRSGEPSA